MHNGLCHVGVRKERKGEHFNIEIRSFRKSILDFFFGIFLSQMPHDVAFHIFSEICGGMIRGSQRFFHSSPSSPSFPFCLLTPSLLFFLSFLLVRVIRMNSSLFSDLSVRFYFRSHFLSYSQGLWSCDLLREQRGKRRGRERRAFHA